MQVCGLHTHPRNYWTEKIWTGLCYRIYFYMQMCSEYEHPGIFKAAGVRRVSKIVKFKRIEHWILLDGGLQRSKMVCKILRNM